MTLAKDARTALDGNDPNVNELKGWFFAGYRLDIVKGKISGIKRTQRLKLTIFSSTDIYKNVQDFKNYKEVDLNDNHDPVSRFGKQLNRNNAYHLKILYCDLSRYEETKAEGPDGKEATYLLDKTTNLLVPKSKEYDGCKTGDTVAYRSAQLKNGQLVKNSIQLCPWYLTVLGHSDYATIDAVTNHKNLKDYDPSRKPADGDPVANVWGSRLDVSLLHEVRVPRWPRSALR
jgi:hypothetical protein